MSQKVIIAVLGGVILLGGGAWYYQTKMSGDNAQSKSGSESKSEGMLNKIAGGVNGAGTFADILGVGDAQECTFSGTDPDTGEYAEGRIYVDGDSFRMEADTTIEGKEGTLYVIQHEKIMYMWSDDEEMMPGIKIDTSMFEEMEGMEGMEKPQSPIDWLKDPESTADYDCSGWLPRPGMFTPPAEVEFMDMFGGMGAMFQGMMESGMMEASQEGEAYVE